MGYRQVWVDGTHIQSLRKVDGLRTLMESCLAIPIRDTLNNIGHDYSCDNNQYASPNLTICQLHIRVGPGGTVAVTIWVVESDVSCLSSIAS